MSTSTVFGGLSDQLNEQLKRIEERFARLYPAAYIQTTFEEIRFGRAVSGVWGEAGLASTAIRNCPIETRIVFVEHLQEFENLLVAKSRDLQARLEAAIEKAYDYLRRETA